jgi:hypothetical protein
MQAVKNQIIEAKNNMPKEINYADKIISLKKAINGLKDNSISPIEKNKLLKAIIKRIEYSNDSKRYDFGINNIKLDIYLQL